TNGSGLTVTASSDGVTVDGTGPVAGTVNDGLVTDLAFQASASSVSANWSGFTDAETGVAGDEWAIGTTAGATDVQAFTAVGASTSATATGLSLVSGSTYYVTVRATNGVGLTATATSNGVVVDSTAPGAGTVEDGSGADVSTQTSTTTLDA